MRVIVSGKRGKLIVLAAIVVVVLGIGSGSYLWYQSSRYVDTENARISAPLIPVASLAPAQIITLHIDVGSYVERGQLVAEVGRPRTPDNSSGEGFKALPSGRIRVEAPVSGFVAAVWAYPGAVVSAGQPIATIYDSSEVWVTANIEETKLNRVRPGQEVDIKVDALGGTTLKGRVEGIAAATAATFSLLPQQNTSGNFIKTVQLVPVKISVDRPSDIVLIPGTSVEVRITTW